MMLKINGTPTPDILGFTLGIVSIPKNNISRNIALYFTQSFLRCSLLDSLAILHNLRF